MHIHFVGSNHYITKPVPPYHMFRSLFMLVLLLSGLNAAAQVMGYVDSVEVHRTDTVYFDFGSAELTEKAQQAVADLANDRMHD